MELVTEVSSLIVGTSRDIAKNIATADLESNKAQKHSAIVMTLCAAVNAPLTIVMSEVVGIEMNEAQLIKYLASHIAEENIDEIVTNTTMAIFEHMLESRKNGI
jgi:hypothetical protein